MKKRKCLLGLEFFFFFFLIICPYPYSAAQFAALQGLCCNPCSRLSNYLRTPVTKWCCCSSLAGLSSKEIFPNSRTEHLFGNRTPIFWMPSRHPDSRDRSRNSDNFPFHLLLGQNRAGFVRRRKDLDALTRPSKLVVAQGCRRSL